MMRPLMSFVALLLCFIVMCVVSCKKDETTVSNPPQEFVVKIDSLKIQKPALSNDTLRARMWGKLGPNTCYSFGRFQTVARDSYSVRIKVYGLYLPSSSCTPTPQALTGAIYRHYPVYPGTFRMFVEQPDGTTIRDTAIVL